jgi:beta-galactosidase
VNSRKQHCLSGNDWFFKLDPRDEGIQKGWFRNKNMFPNKIRVPGAWQAQGFGGKGTNIMYQIPLEPLQVERWAYKGTGWYKKPFVVPKDWQGKKIRLRFGAVNPRGEVWVNGERVGTDNGGLIGFNFDISRIVKYGEENVVTVRVYEHNRDYYYADQGGILNFSATWSGLYRDVFLEATDKTHIERLTILPDIEKEQARIKVSIESDASTISGPSLLRISARSPRTRDAIAIEKIIHLKPGAQAEELVLKIKSPCLWSPDDPHLYTVRGELIVDGKVIDVVEDRFGMRNFGVTDTKILLNGKPVYLRGYAFHLMYPLTLAPTTDMSYLRKMLRLGKSYGFNKVHIYGYPHPEYMDACDEVGMFLQVFPRTLGDPRRPENPVHMKKLMLEHINHPCIMTYGWGSEIYKHDRDLCDLFNRLYENSRNLDPTRLNVARDGSRLRNIGLNESDFEIIGLGSGGMQGVFYYDPKMVQAYKRPFIVHEYAWWSSYPDSRLKEKYKGAMLPYFIDYAEKKARQNGLQKLLPVFAENSQKLQAIERKTCLEAIRTVPNINGFDLWTGHDTGCGMMGVWDDFGGAKNISAMEFMKTNADTVLLMEQDFKGREGWVDKHYCKWEMKIAHLMSVWQPEKVKKDPNDTPWVVNPAFQGRTLWEGETLKFKLLISHFGPEKIKSALLDWKLKVASSGRILRSGRKRLNSVKSFRPDSALGVCIKIPTLKKAEKLTLSATLSWAEQTVSNDWDFWSFPRGWDWNPGKKVALSGEAEPAKRFGFIYPLGEGKETPDLLVSSILNNEVIDYLEKGGRVFLLSEGLLPEYHSSFHSIPWSGRAWGNSGTVIDKRHSALKNFPHEGFCDLQFYDLVNIRKQCPPRTGVINLDIWPKRIDPIIRSIDSYMGAKSRGYLLEAKVGKGRLLVSRLDFTKTTPAGKFLFSELIRYALSGEFKPKVTIPASFFRAYASDGPAFSERIEEGLCCWEPTSVLCPCHPPAYAQKDDMATFWTSSGPGPKDLGLKFKKPRTLSRISIVFLSETDVRESRYYSQPAEDGYELQYWTDGRWKTLEKPVLTKRDFTRPDVVLALTDRVGDGGMTEDEGTWQWDFSFEKIVTSQIRILINKCINPKGRPAVIHLEVNKV